MICRFLSVVVRCCDVSGEVVGSLLFSGLLWVARLLSWMPIWRCRFLVMVRVVWLPVGMARGVLSLVRAVVAGDWVPKAEAGRASSLSVGGG